ncbi:MAG: hypothetical protein NHB32_20885 [Fischerella sp. CENA71]|nr:hypothetical protein [Fischerella sp. CENA71]
MTRIAISDISLEESYLADLSETESAFIQGGLDFNSLILGLATLSAVVALKKIDAIQTIFITSIKAIASI